MNLEFDLIDQAVHTLRSLPEAEVHSVVRNVTVADAKADAIAYGTIKAHPVQFILEVKTGGYPRDARNAIWQMEKLQRADPIPFSIPLFVAPSISESSRALLQDHKVGYVDGGGSVYVVTPWSVYVIDRPVPATRPRELRNIYRGSAAQVTHALLIEHNRAWHLTELAQRAEVSVSTVHQVCSYLERQLWMEQRGRGPESTRSLLNPGALLDGWAENHSLSRYKVRRFHGWARDPKTIWKAFSSHLSSQEIEHAFTLGSGAHLVAPFATNTDQAWVLMSSEHENLVDDIANQSSMLAVDEGESFTVFLTRERSPLLFRHLVEDICVASDVQLYLDLMAWPRRGREQAQHLRRERLSY